MTSTHVQEVDGDTATGTVYFFATGNNKDGDSTAFFCPGYYKDKYVRGPEGWLIKERQINVNFSAMLPGILCGLWAQWAFRLASVSSPTCTLLA